MNSILILSGIFRYGLGHENCWSSRATASIPRRKHGGAVPPYVVGSRRLLTGFGSPKFFTDKYVPANQAGVMLKVPNFDALFGEICAVSPLAKQALTDQPGGIKSIDKSDDVYKWKVIESSHKLVSHIDKIDNFQQKGVPLLRFRSTLHGPTTKRAECFSELISITTLRHKWDVTNDLVDTIYSAANLTDIQQYIGEEYGELSLFGIGYVKTKQSVVSPREQLTLCAVHNFPSGASIIWGVELEEDQNHLFPKDQPNRKPRSTSHLFSTTLIPTDENTFDVEYVLQLEVGGFPSWLTGPVVIETVKKMFRFADGYFKSGLDGGELAQRLEQLKADSTLTDPKKLSETNEAAILDREMTLLMPP